MIIDSLTITGLVATSAFALMPVLMGREFIRVRECPAPQPSYANSPEQRARQPLELAEGCVES